MAKVILYVAISMDGYVATEDDGLAWLNEIRGEGDNGFSQMYSRITTVVMGRRTFDILNQLVDVYPHNDRMNYIFTNQPNFPQSDMIRVAQGDVQQWLTDYRRTNTGDVWLVGGGQLVSQFLVADLIDELILTVAPLHIGKGIPLWQPTPFVRYWHLNQLIQSGQFVQMYYTRATRER